MKIPIKVEMAKREERRGRETKERNKVNEKISFVKREERRNLT